MSSKFAICGLPIRVDTYKTCSFGCKYCFADNRKIMEYEKSLCVGNIDSVRKRLYRIFEKGQIKQNNFLDTLIADKITWHCGGMSDPFQPCESKLMITKDLIEASAPYGISILFSTKSDTVYDANIDPALHTFQLSVTNVNNNKQLEPNVPDIEKRLQLFKCLKQNGFRVGIRMQPFIPNITTLDIVKMFTGADNFTLEGIKIVPQNAQHKDFILRECGLSSKDFTQMGLLNLKPEIRDVIYQPFIAYFTDNNIPFSIADNDMHYISTNKCCCGDSLVTKSTNFNNTAMIYKYGMNYTLKNVKTELNQHGCAECKCNQLFTSNRQEGCMTTTDFFEKRFDRKSSPFSPKFLYKASV